MKDPHLDDKGRTRGMAALDLETPAHEDAEFDLRRVLHSLRRQWVILMVLLLATSGAALGATLKLPPTYQSIGTVVLVPPGGGANGANPYDRFTSADHILAKVVLTSVTSEAVTEQIASHGGVPYTVTTDLESPTMTITATGADPANTEGTMLAVIDAVRSFLADNQRSTGTAPSTWFTVAPISVPASAKKTAAGLRNGAIVAVLGLIAAVSIALLADQRALRRRRRLASSRRQAGLAWRDVDARPLSGPASTPAKSRSARVPGGVTADPRNS